MNHFLLDTDTFSLFLQGDVRVMSAVIAHFSDPVAISIITVQEVWGGWATALARAKTAAVLAATYARLTETVREVGNWPVVTLSVAAIARYEALKKQKLNVGGNDLRIASIALELGATVVTRNRVDFSRVPGIVLEDWSV